VVASTANDRAFVTYQGANKMLPEVLRRAADAGEFSEARHVHLACAPNLSGAFDLLDILHGHGCTVSLDVGWHTEWLDAPLAVAVLSHVDIFFPNEAEGLRITGTSDPDEALERFAASNISRVALKLGCNGALLLWDGQVLRSGPQCVAPIDATGAGDCFDAGFVYAWLAGRSPQECLDAANLCGALSTEARGGIAGFPGIDKLAQAWQ
jgi:sugar/nucleoside kinase (ribokinase family)